MEKRIILVCAIVVVAVLAVYFSFFYTKNCQDDICFESSMAKCSKASYIDDKADAVWQYRIIEKEKGDCIIKVKLIQLKQGTTNMGSLEGKDMDCYVPRGIVITPQSELERCHGNLKEEMQKIMINKLFSYISGNVGTISEELKKVI
jgi:hypothetical protein